MLSASGGVPQSNPGRKCPCTTEEGAGLPRAQGEMGIWEAREYFRYGANNLLMLPASSLLVQNESPLGELLKSEDRFRLPSKKSQRSRTQGSVHSLREKLVPLGQAAGEKRKEGMLGQNSPPAWPQCTTGMLAAQAYKRLSGMFGPWRRGLG